MRVESLREQVLEANLELVRRGLVLYTFGNASGISRQEGVIAIKPSGVPYEQLTVEQIVVTDLAGSVVEAIFDLPPIYLPMSNFIVNAPLSEEWLTRTPNSLQPGHRRVVPFRALGRRTQKLSAD
jgi:ribulose-5-phosphate 4-epimerase/fuculose-1-phosphate aldolase